MSQSNPEWSYDDFDKNAKKFCIRLIDYIKEKIANNVEQETVQLELKSWLFNRIQKSDTHDDEATNIHDLPLMALNTGVYDSILSMLNTSGGLIVIGIKQNGEFAKLLFEIADVAEKLTPKPSNYEEFTNFKKDHPATWSEDLHDNERDLLEAHYERTAQRKIVDYIAKNTNFGRIEVEEFLKIRKARYKYKSANESLLLIFITRNEDGKLLWQHHSKFIKDNQKSVYLTRVNGQNLPKSQKEVDNRLEIYNKKSPATYEQMESLKETTKKLLEAQMVTEKAAKEAAAAQKILDDGKATAAEKEKAKTDKKFAEFANIEKSIYFRTLLEDILRNQNEYYADTMSRFDDFERQTKGEREEFIPEGLSPEDELLTHKNLLKKLKEIRDTGLVDQDKKRKIEDQIKKLEDKSIPYFEKEVAKQQKDEEDPITVPPNGSPHPPDPGPPDPGPPDPGPPGSSSMPTPRSTDWKIVIIILGILVFAVWAISINNQPNQSPPGGEDPPPGGEDPPPGGEDPPPPAPEPEFTLFAVSADWNLQEGAYVTTIGDVLFLEGVLGGAEKSYEICVYASDPNRYNEPQIQDETFVTIAYGIAVVDMNGLFTAEWTVHNDFPWDGNKILIDAAICDTPEISSGYYSLIIRDLTSPPPPAPEPEPEPEPPAPEPATPITLEQNKRIILRGTSGENSAGQPCNTYVQTAANGTYEPQNDKTIFFGQMMNSACAKSIIVYDLNSVLDKLDDNNVDSITLSFIALKTYNEPVGNDDNGCQDLKFPSRSGRRHYCLTPNDLKAELKYFLSEDANCAATNKELFESLEGWTEVTSWGYETPDTTVNNSTDISQIKVDVNSTSNRYLCLSFTDEINTSGDEGGQDNYRLHALRDIEIKFNFVLQ